MAKRKPVIRFNVPVYRDEPYVVYFLEIDSDKKTTTVPKEKARYSDRNDAHNFLAGVFENMRNTDATFEDSTIIQQNERKPNISWKWYIEDERE